MAGNVVMVKHAGCVPQCAIAFSKLRLDAGAPVGAYTNLLISHDQVNQVIDDPRIKGVALTGGVEAARSVAARAGKNVKKTTMELGGNDALIVLADADLDATVKWALWAKMNNAGQCCAAAKRFIIAEEIADALVEKFQAALTALKPGDPAYREEFFGPVALIFRVKNEDEAVALANDSDFGLGGTIFSKNIVRAKALATRVGTGMVFINHPTWTACDLPFGGIKNPGYGWELSALGIQEFVNRKLVRTSSIDAPA